MTIPSRVLFFTAALAFAFMGCPGGGGGNTGGGTGTTGGGIGFSGGGTGSTTGGGAGSTGGGAGSTGGGAGSTGGGAGSTGGGAGSTGGGAGSTGGGAGSTGGGAGSTGGGTAVTCTEVQFTDFSVFAHDTTFVGVRSTVTPSLSTGGDTGFVVVQGDLTTGTYTLGTGVDDNLSTCSRCVVVDGDKTFFQESGSFVVTTADGDAGVLTATLTDVKLIEVTIDSQNASTPVPNGACVHIASLSVNAAYVPPPSGWTCSESWYGDGQYCDCGCGALDSDCANNTDINACDDCSCSNNSVDGGLMLSTCDSADTTQCTAGSFVAWTCDISSYNDGFDCNCGCGSQDVDCTSTTDLAECSSCGCTTSVDGGIMAAACQATDTTQCTAGSFVAWACSPFYYGADDGCDCGCGAVDLDCADAGIEVCSYCNEPGSCTLDLVDAGVAPGTPSADGGVRPRNCGYINPTNNAVCQ